MEQITIAAGIMAMAVGVFLFSAGLYGWRPVAERAGGWLEAPMAMAGALVWAVRWSLRVSGVAARPRVTVARGPDIMSQSAAPPGGAPTSPSVADPAPADPKVPSSAPSKRATASGRRTGRRKRSRRSTGTGTRAKAESKSKSRASRPRS